MPVTIDCFFPLSSPWAYLGGPRLEDVARRHKAKLIIRPYHFFDVAPHTGTILASQRPPRRQEYQKMDLARWGEYLGMPINVTPKFYPVDNHPAGHLVCAAILMGHEDVQRLAHAILRALWAEERNIGDSGVRRAIADENGFPGRELVEYEDSEDTRALYRKNTAEAIERGVFGAPTYFCNGNMYWGQDRIFLLDRDLHVGKKAI